MQYRTPKAQADHARSVAVERIGLQAGRLPPALLTELSAALRLYLGWPGGRPIRPWAGQLVLWPMTGT